MQNSRKNSSVKCKIDGCDRLAMYIEKELCQKHYFRIMRNGHARKLISSEKEKGIRSRKEFHLTPNGYKRIYSEGHPLAIKNWVFEHRFVMYEKYGDTLPACELCGKEINWSNCHIDHKDENRLNNNEFNLRPLCRQCNTFREIKGVLNPRANILEVNGVKKTIPEWAKEENVRFCAASIIRRVTKGMSPEDAVYGKKKTHNGNKIQTYYVRKTQFKHERKNAIRITIETETKTAAEWSRDERCKVSQEAIIYRIKNGWDHKDAVFKTGRSGLEDRKRLS